MAGEIERSSEPIPRGHSELASTTVLPQLRNGKHGPLEGMGVDRHPVPDTSEVGQVEGRRPQPRNGPGRSSTENRQLGEDVSLPQEHGKESEEPKDGEERGLVDGDEYGDQSPEVEAAVVVE